jgi:hypothetical protein
MKLLLTFMVCLLLIPCVGADLKIVNDPAQIGVGSRSLGMGGVLLNFTDISSLFGNPAALNHVRSPQFTMMSGKFLNEVDYLSGGAVFPTFIGVVGIGYSSSQLSLTGPLPTIEVVDGIIIVPSTTEVRTDTYGSSTLQFSLSKPARDFIKIGLFEKLLLGGTLKVFSQNLSATGVSGTAQGYEVDLGFKYAVNPWTDFSLVGKNLLPAANGGKLIWEPTGKEETFPYFIKLGLKIKMDRGIDIINIRDQSLTFAFEYDYHPRGNSPDLLHYGLEWGLSEFLDLRVGRDQGYIGRGGTDVFDIANNLTYGVGVEYRGWRFDYAFHEYYGIPENNTHYFSLSYGFPYKEIPKKIKKLAVLPEDKFITNRESIEITGEILDKEIKGITVNNKPIIVVDNAFASNVNLSLGKNRIFVLGIDSRTRSITSESRRILRLVGFNDVGPTHWAKDSIEVLATLGIIKGYPDNLFKPENGITRAEFAALLARLVGEGEYQTQGEIPFSDINQNHWAYRAVAYALDNNLVKGYPDGTFRPNKKISRAEGVAVIARFAGLDFGATIYENPYQDIPGRHWAFDEINAAKTAGFLKHLENNFYPNAELSRAETAVILVKVKYIKDKVDNLLDFEKGYE